MERILRMNRIFNICRSRFIEEEREITFNEALILETLMKKNSILRELETVLQKDRGYMCRLMKRVMKAGYVDREDKIYGLTRRGRKKAIKSREVLTGIIEELEE